MLFENEFLHYVLLYSGNDKQQHTFRVELRMKDEVDPKALIDAAQTAIKRYPYFAIEVIWENDEMEVIFNERPISVTEGVCAPTLCTDEVNRHALAIVYSGNRIFIDVHHGLTDGTGIERFAKTLMYYYINQKYDIELDAEGIHLADSEILKAEYSDPFAHVSKEATPALSAYKAEAAFDLGSVNEVLDDKMVYYLKVNEKDLMKFSRHNDASPNAIFSALMYRSIIEHHPDIEMPVVGGVAITMRNVYKASESAASLIGITHIKYPHKVKEYSLDKLGTIGRGSIILQADEQNVLAGVAPKFQLINYLKTMPDHHMRRATYMHLVKQTTALDTFSISYVGKKDWDVFNDYIDAYYTMSEPKVGGLLLEINTHGGYFDICITQDFKSDRYVNSLMKLLKEHDVEVEFVGKELLKLPQQRIF